MKSVEIYQITAKVGYPDCGAEYPVEVLVTTEVELYIAMAKSIVGNLYPERTNIANVNVKKIG